MKTILTMVLLVLMASQCTTRKKIKNKLNYQTSETIKTDTNTVTSTETKVLETKIIDKVVEKKQQESGGDIIIKGKTDSVKDFHYHNIVRGDTLADIYIKGNADFIIKNRWNEKQSTEKEISKAEDLNIVAKVARKAVAASTIKSAAGKIVETEKEIKSTGFSLPVYLIAGGLAGAALLFYLFFGDIKKIFKKLT